MRWMSQKGIVCSVKYKRLSFLPFFGIFFLLISDCKSFSAFHFSPRFSKYACLSVSPKGSVSCLRNHVQFTPSKMSHLQPHLSLPAWSSILKLIVHSVCKKQAHMAIRVNATSSLLSSVHLWGSLFLCLFLKKEKRRVRSSIDPADTEWPVTEDLI